MPERAIDLRRSVFPAAGRQPMDLRHVRHAPATSSDHPMARHSPSTVVMRQKGKKPITFKKGALHRQLGVPEGTPIPASKKRAALRGAYGPKAKKRASFAFKGALATGRRTAAR